MKSSEESAFKLPVKTDESGIVTISSDEEDKHSEPNKHDITGKRKDTSQQRDKRRIGAQSYQKSSTRQISPVFESMPSKSPTTLRNRNADTSTLRKSRLLNNKNPSLRNSTIPMPPPSSSSSTSSSSKSKTPFAFYASDDAKLLDDDNYHSQFDKPKLQSPTNDRLPDYACVSPVRQSSPLQHPPISTDMNGIPSGMEHLGIASPASNPLSKNPDPDRLSFDISDYEFVNEHMSRGKSINNDNAIVNDSSINTSIFGLISENSISNDDTGRLGENEVSNNKNNDIGMINDNPISHDDIKRLAGNETDNNNNDIGFISDSSINNDDIGMINDSSISNADIGRIGENKFDNDDIGMISDSCNDDIGRIVENKLGNDDIGMISDNSIINADIGGVGRNKLDIDDIGMLSDSSINNEDIGRLGENDGDNNDNNNIGFISDSSINNDDIGKLGENDSDNNDNNDIGFISDNSISNGDIGKVEEKEISNDSDEMTRKNDANFNCELTTKEDIDDENDMYFDCHSALDIGDDKNISEGKGQTGIIEWDSDNEMDSINEFIDDRTISETASSPPSSSKSNGSTKDQPALFIPRRSERQRTKLATRRWDGVENDVFDFDFDLNTPTSYQKSLASRKHKSMERRKKTSPTPVELSDDDMDEQSHTILFTYPVDRSKGSITITTKDQSRLRPSEFLNDSVIDFYLKWLMDSYSGANGHDLPNATKRQTAEDTHIFSTLFYNRLTQGRRNSVSYENVRKWTSKIDLFSKKHAIFPINENWHWYLVLIYNLDRCIPGKETLSSDSELQDDDDTNLPHVFVLDSLGGRQKKCVRDLIAYLKMEAGSRRGLGSSDFIAPKLAPAKVPKQDNSCDCGVFLLHFVDQFMNSPQEFIDTLLVQDAQHEIWKEDEIKQKRGELQKLFTTVQNQYSIVNSSLAENC
ncbi:unnamed protein product [Absidia cylindrospora]